MAVYAVYEPPLKEDAAGVAETMERALRFKFVRDGFSFWAFLLGPVWMLFHRLWLALVCYIVLIFAITLVAFSFGLAEGAVTIASLLIALLLGFEAATLRRRKLLRWHWRDLGVVVEKNREAAERRFFDRWAATASAEPVVLSSLWQQPAPVPAETTPIMTPAPAQPAAVEAAIPARMPTYDPESYVIGMFPPKDKPPGGNP